MTNTFPKGEARIGPSCWRDDTKHEVKLSHAVIRKSDRSQEVGRAVDPLPVFRDTLMEMSKDHILLYMRDTRAVVYRLRERFLETNDEIKALTRVREATEKALEHKRKDLSLSQKSTDIRTTRPRREQPRDGADDLLNAERLHLFNLKRTLEAQLRTVQQMLVTLGHCRRRLQAVIQERSLVLDFITQAGTSLMATPSKYTASKSENGASRMPPADPLSPYTPEAAAAAAEAEQNIKVSKCLRKDTRALIGQTTSLQRQAHLSVNDALTRKIAETVSLSQDLAVQEGENRHALNRAVNFFENTERTYGIQLGPLSAQDLTAKEKLTRPMVQVFQRHPGTQLPEAQAIIKSADGLLEALTVGSRNIASLTCTQNRLHADRTDKERGYQTDSSVVRLRRRNAAHRWVMPIIR